jgi:hypothetical protein
MKVLNLRCIHDHRFEGWFGAGEDFESQQERGLVECPVCGDKAIERLPSAPRLNVLAHRHAESAADAKPASPEQAQAQWMGALRHVLENTEDVGERFPEEARRIHYGEVRPRGIRGQASREDAQALRDEGVEVVAVSMPPGLKGPLQ